MRGDGGSGSVRGDGGSGNVRGDGGSGNVHTCPVLPYAFQDYFGLSEIP